jgi:hypothetical protein
MAFKETKKVYGDMNDIWNANWKDDKAKGSVLEGVVVEKKEQDFKDDKTGKTRTRAFWVIQDKAGKQLRTPAHAELIAGMHDVAIGKTVRLTYLGPVMSERSSTFVPGYKVEVDE